MSVCEIPTIPTDVDGDNRWMSQHKSQVLEAKGKEPDVVFIGDGVIQNLQQVSIWRDLFEPLHSLNFGIFFDKTQNVLWRVENGIFDFIKPKVVVLHVGTFNLDEPANEIASGIVKIVEAIQKKLPDVFIILLEILPRGENPNLLRRRNDDINSQLRDRLQGYSKLEIVPTAEGLIQPDGSVSHHDMLDYLIPTNSGYKKIFQPVYELIVDMLDDNSHYNDSTLG